MAVAVKNALISVSDKSGLVELAQALSAAGVTIYSTGGTRKALQTAGVKVRDVAEYTGFPEMMDGRVKTLHPKIFGGILGRRDQREDMEAMDENDMVPFDLVVVNLYPFQATIAKPGVRFEECIEQIDIGGPSLVRAAAKNHAFCAIATAAEQYPQIVQELKTSGAISADLRRQLAAAAYAHTAAYDAAISAWFAGQLAPPAQAATAEPDTASDVFPAELTIRLQRRETLRYGENPHQPAAVYENAGPSTKQSSLLSARQLNGKELSYNNLLDLDSAVAMVRSLAEPGVSVIKHNNPCGAAVDAVLSVAARKALDGDPVSAFGSVLAFNRPLDAATAEVLAEPGRFIEAVAAPGFADEALKILTTRPKWKASVRLLDLGQLGPLPAEIQLRAVDGGYLAQLADHEADDESQWKVVTKKSLDAALQNELRFAWHMVRFVKSNAIVVAKDTSLLGVGAGQMSRVDSVRIAIEKAGERVAGAVLASDAFFPFPDSVEIAAAAGITALVQPGGSVRDSEVIDACDRLGLTMVFTGRRHFRH